MLGGRYQLLERIGRGAAAEVWQARDQRLDRLVAVKMLRTDVGLETNAVARFEREARIAAGLNHPNIVSVYDTGVDEGTPWMAMELVDGRTLADLLKSGPLGVERSLSLATQIAQALEHAHQAGLVHRDVKPANIMVDDQDRVKVVDFGITTAMGADTRLTVTGMVVGTLAYLAPELAAGGLPSPSSDLYSLGVVLFEMLTGRPPFPASNLAESVLAHQQETAPRLTTLAAVPETVEAVVGRLMAKSPEDRFGSAGELITALADPTSSPVRGSDQTRMMPLPAVAAAEEPVRRSSRPWLAFSVILLVVAVIGALSRYRPSTEPIALPSTTVTPATLPPTTLTVTTLTPTTVTPTTLTPSTTTVEDVVEAIRRSIVTVIEGSSMRSKTANDLTKAVDDAVKAFLAGDRERAAKRLEDAFEIAREIIDRDLENEIDDLLVELAEAMGFEVRRG